MEQHILHVLLETNYWKNYLGLDFKRFGQNMLIHIFPKAQVAANKSAYNLRHKVFHALSHGVIHFVWSVSFNGGF